MTHSKADVVCPAPDRVLSTLALRDPIDSIKGLSKARKSALERLGIYTLKDLLFYPPIRYVDFTDVRSISLCRIGETVTIVGKVDAVKSRASRRRMKIVEASVIDDTGLVNVIWFNQPWIANSISKGDTIALQGTLDHRYGYLQMASPRYMILGEGQDSGIIPVYRQTRGITTAWIQKYVSEALATCRCMIDPIPAKLRLQRKLMSRQSAFAALHFPRDMQEAAEAKHRLAYEELLYLQIHWALERAGQENAPAFEHFSNGSMLAAYLKSIPYTLTKDQRQSLDEILADMASNKRMNRMLLGDVGTGKTAVAAAALACVADNNSQAALMAPTEVLARQYAVKIGPIFDKIGISWALLASTTSAAERKQIIADLGNGQLTVLFCTHAVLEDDVVFNNMTLAIIDEQHRFGVTQRETLKDKGTSNDYLCMTATPIPRSLALTMYGSLDTSYIRQRPGGNRKIETIVVQKHNRFIAYDEIRACVAAGHQAYLICPLVGESSASANADENSDTTDRAEQHTAGKSTNAKAARTQSFEGFTTATADANTDAGKNDESLRDAGEGEEAPRLLAEEDLERAGSNLKAARAEAEYLAREVFPHMNIGLLCGKMPAKEKSEVMESFRRGEIDVLVSTTVVEVGVDVPNATVMVIEDAERFGLSQLHQLRGRVGRGEHPGKVVLLADSRSQEAAMRMDAMQSSSDGFALAELDLSLRHEGDVSGSRQHGMPGLRFSNLVSDADLIEASRQDAIDIVRQDPDLSLSEHRLLAHEIFLAYPDGLS